MIKSEVPVFAPLQGKIQARLCGIVDGDTLIAIILADNEPRMIKIRVSGIDTPEKIGATKNSGIDATKSAYEFFDIMNIYDPRVKRQTVNSRKRFLTETNVLIELEFNKIKNFSDQEKFGRYLAKVYFNGKSLGDHLIAKGLAKEYQGGTKNQEEWM